MRARIRDFLKTDEGWILAVADYNHPCGIRSMLRYVPDPAGERTSPDGMRYRKLDFDAAFEYLRQVRPDYVQDLHVIPEDKVLCLYRPEKVLPSVARRNPKVEMIASVLRDGGISQEGMGITGSWLVGLEGPTSDIDFVVYGDAWQKARDLIARAKEKDGHIQDLDEVTWKKIYAKRKPEINFDEFVVHEKRKGNRGLVDGTYFDLLFTRGWDQIKTALPGKAVGRRKIEARVVETDFAFDNPAVFKLDHEIGEVHCYTHTYAGQALPGETVEVRGMVEETEAGLRMVVGTTREARGEWIRSLTLLEKTSRRS